ncbi:MAG: TPM domain-containing protein [bacterium]
MKKTIMMLMMTIFCLSTFAEVKIPARPNPAQLVMDYPGVLQPEQLQALKQKLVAFDKKTSIQLQVVIMDDIDGQIAGDVALEILNQWGVGQKKLNNGLVFLVVKYNANAISKLSKKKHCDCSIKTGYGLEQYITDALSKRILHQIFIPLAKNDQYYEGINASIDEMIKELGDAGWQQRKEFEANKKAESEQTMRDFGHNLLMFILIAIVLGLLIWLFIRVRKETLKAQELKQRKESLKKSFSEAKSKFENFLVMIPNDISSYPSWAVELHTKIINNIDRAIKQPAKSVIDEFPTIIETNMVRASQILSILTGCVSEMEKSIAELETIPNDIKKYRDEAPVKLKAAEDRLQNFSVSIQEFKQKGFKLTSYEDKLSNFKLLLSKTKEKVNSKQDNGKDICLESNAIKEAIEKTMKVMQSYLDNRESTSKIIASINSEISNLPSKREAAQKVLDQLKSENPKENWELLDKLFGGLAPLLSLCQLKKDEAENKNGMDVQDFDTAKSLADEANEKMMRILNCLLEIHHRKDEIINAKASFESLLSTTQKEITDAENKTSDSDVKSGAKTKVMDAGRKMKEAKNETSNSLINWLLVVELLNKSRSLAAEGYRMAENDIQQAENERARIAAAAAALILEQERERDREREEEREREREREREEERKDNDTNYGGGKGGGGGADDSF